MNRRDLLRSILPLAAVPGITVKHVGQEVGKSFELDHKSKFLCILNGDAVDVESFCYGYDGHGLPPGTPVIIVPGHVPLDDVLRIYKLEDS